MSVWLVCRSERSTNGDNKHRKIKQKQGHLQRTISGDLSNLGGTKQKRKKNLLSNETFGAGKRDNCAMNPIGGAKTLGGSQRSSAQQFSLSWRH